MSNVNEVQDPVCKMDVDKGQLSYSYMGIEYSFCSQQCNDRFSANPHLYIGRPGKSSPKQNGESIIKRRTLKLDEVISEDDAKKINTELRDMMGIKLVTIDKNIIRITYDLLEATTEQIETTITATGKNLTTGLADKIKRAFVHYLEESELDLLEEQYIQHKSCHE